MNAENTAPCSLFFSGPKVVETQPADPRTSPLAAQVARLEWRVAQLDALCGEMLACLHVNHGRGSLKTDDEDTFRLLLGSWSRQRELANRQG